jgi:hypothetical protein
MKLFVFKMRLGVVVVSGSHAIAAIVPQPAVVGDFGRLICPDKIKNKGEKNDDITELAPIEAGRCYLLGFFCAVCSVQSVIVLKLNNLSK